MDFGKFHRKFISLRRKIIPGQRKKRLGETEEAFLLRRIREELPEIEWNNYRYLTHGWDHIIVILDGKIVFRIPRNLYYEIELKNEIQLLHCLRKEVKAGIPEYNYVSRDQSIAGYDMLMGCELTGSRFLQLSASEKDIVAEQLAEFITALHATPKSIIKKFHVKSDYQQRLYEDLLRESKNLIFPRLPKEDIQLVVQYFAQLRTALDHEFTNTLIHNDLTGEHILWDAENRQVNIIDFSDHRFGDPACDFTGFLEYGTKFTRQVFELYGGEKDDGMFDRSQLYFKRIPLYVMKGSLQGFPCTFEQGYETFKKLFKV